MKKYRVLVTRPDGSKIFQPVQFTNKKKAIEWAREWENIHPDYKHDVITETR